MEEKIVNEALLRKLYDAACEVHNEDEFLLAICSIVSHDDDIQTVIDFIEQSKNITPSDVLLLIVKLNQQRFPEDYIWEE